MPRAEVPDAEHTLNIDVTNAGGALVQEHAHPHAPAAAAPVEVTEPVQQLHEMLVSNLGRVLDLFRSLDEDCSGLLNKAEFCRALPLLGLPDEDDTAGKLFCALDIDCSGTIDYRELHQALPRRAGDVDGKDDVLLAQAQMNTLADERSLEPSEMQVEELVDGVDDVSGRLGLMDRGPVPVPTRIAISRATSAPAAITCSATPRDHAGRAEDVFGDAE